MSEQLENNLSQGVVPDEHADETNLLDLLIVLVRHKKLVIALPIITGVIALAVSMMMTPIFTSTAKILPPQQQGSGAAAMLGQLGNLAGAAGAIAGIKNPNDLYVGMLESRTIADNLINRFNLKERYESGNMEDARSALALASQLTNSKKDGLIWISVNDQDPKFAADLANAYVDELIKLLQTMAVSEASQRRLFFEKQMQEAKDKLADAEVALRTTQEKTGMLHPDGQVQAIISSAAQLKATIAAKEVQINAMKTFATGQNPDVLRAQEELRGLQVQLAKLEKNHASQEADFMVPTGKLPEAGVEYIRSLRNVKYYEAMFELMAKQYELAKIDEAKDPSTIQLLDKAVPADKKSKPKRGVITLVGLIGGGVLGVLLAFALEAYARARQRPENIQRWKDLSAAL